MLCDNCIKELAARMTPEAKKVFGTLAKENKWMSKSDIQRMSGLSRALTNKGVLQLETNLFIRSRVDGRANVYWLTNAGARLVELMAGEK